MSKSRSISIDVDLGDFDDDDIVGEIIDRDLVAEVLQAAGHVQKEKDAKKPIKSSDIATDALGHLMCRRHATAKADLDRLITTFVPPEVWAAHQALVNGDAALAICELERHINPSPAATISLVEYQKLHAKAVP